MGHMQEQGASGTCRGICLHMHTGVTSMDGRTQQQHIASHARTGGTGHGCAHVPEDILISSERGEGERVEEQQAR